MKLRVLKKGETFISSGKLRFDCINISKYHLSDIHHTIYSVDAFEY